MMKFADLHLDVIGDNISYMSDRGYGASCVRKHALQPLYLSSVLCPQTSLVHSEHVTLILTRDKSPCSP